MQHQSDGTLILKLATLFLGTQVKSEVIREALSLICEQCRFNRGLVYDINQYNQFHLAEQVGAEVPPPPAQFPIEAISPGNRAALAEKICYHTQSGQPSLDEELHRLFGEGGLSVTPVVDENLRIYGLIVFLGDADDARVEAVLPAFAMLCRYVGIRMYQHKLYFAQASLESVLDNTGIDIYVNDFYTHDILYVNRSMAAPYGGRAAFMGDKCWRVLFPGQSGPCEFCPQKKLIDEDGNPTKVYTWDYQRPFDGSWFRVFSSAFQWADGRLAHVVSSADITDNKRNEAMVEYLANYDALTNLPNRRMLLRDFTERIEQLTEDEMGYLLFFDIDGFKAINDSYGHDAGDEFLVMLGQFFSEIPLLKDAIYRNGGDEFVALIGGCITKASVRSLAGFIHDRFRRPWALKSGAVYCNVSIGVACYPEDGLVAEDLLTIADRAMYRVKKTGGGDVGFASET